MLNEDKIKLMTSISMFEKKEGRYIFPMNHYFRGDYISSHLVRSFIGYTFCWLIGTLVWALYEIEYLFSPAVMDHIHVFLLRFGIYYSAGLIVYLIITSVVYGKRYRSASRGMKVYVAKLRRLEKRYEYQNKTKDITREGGRT